MSDKSKKPHRPATKLVEAGRRPEWTGAVVSPPVWRASTHIYDNEAERVAALKDNADGQFFYGRRGAPTQWALAEALTEIEPGAYGTMLYPSGVAAITGALLAVLRHGDTVLISDNSYEPTRNLARGLLPRAVWLESPGSLTMEICDVPQLAAIARENAAVSLLDNTWASPIGFTALQNGCDISVMSLSKHVGGHSDLMMGSATAGEKWYRRLRQTSQQLGQVVSPDDAALALRGLRTLKVRLEQSSRSALEIARWLQTRPEVAHVMCPMLPGDQGHDL
jgi:cystathionine beta-lyase